MSVTHIDIDPEGDTLIILLHDEPEPEPKMESGEEPDVEEPEPDKVNEEKSDDEMTNDEEPDPQTCFKVSMKHLVLASPRAKKMFDGNYIEVQLHSDGLRRWTFEPIFNPEAFEIVLNAIHGHTHKLPETVQLEQLANIAAIVDDLDCPQALWFFAKIWIEKFNPKYYTVDLPFWILISFVFDEPDMFNQATKYAILDGKGSFHDAGLPIRPKISDSLRQDHISSMVTKLNSIMQVIETGSCTHECKVLLFGAFTLDLMSAKLTLPCPSTPFPGLGVEEIINWIQKFQLPKVYRLDDLPRNNPDLTKDTWIYLDAKNKPIKHNLSLDSPAEGHSCALRSLVTTSVSAALAKVNGLSLTYFRQNL
ncbi:hypothetical protein CEP53_013370 [Fusarium sp. AF-6]|nr:hypothetical protein CEP53_013370 [Fusarium sp. AF-6]